MKKLKIGDKVVRGPSWMWEEQDCGKFGRRCSGEVIEGENRDGWYSVKWSTGYVNSYRYTKEEKDIEIIEMLKQEELEF